MLMGCQAQTSVLPKSQKLSADKVAEIAATIERTYPKLSTEIRGQLLNTVVKSLDNMVFVEGGEFQMGDFGWPHNFDITNMCDWPCGMDPERMGPLSMGTDNKFVHPVKLSSYSLSKYQTTLGDFDLGGLKEQVQQSVNFLSLLSETIPLPKHRYQWASDRTELT
jgi:formylglycine-generating enzyme required for sulfatase activity